MFERFTKEARDTVRRAQEEARDLRHGWIGTEHLLLASLRRPEQPGVATLARLGVTATSCRGAVAGVVSARSGALGPEDAEALRAFGIDLDEVSRKAEENFGPGALHGPLDDPEPGRRPRGVFGRRSRDGEDDTGAGAVKGHIPFSPRAKKALELTLREAVARNDRRIGPEHLTLALLRSDDRITRAVFDRLGIAPKDVRELVLDDLRQAA
ncbi:Clp protease N-terminal domain-containing protein [Streptomyces albiaxialis]|uniref:Clp protease N-terminal domain-containing protein n=1 Tax=Streptomyces albiaxialis TaxID=329523 RepID=A0ABN2WC73_9ACTN